MAANVTGENVQVMLLQVYMYTYIENVSIVADRSVAYLNIYFVSCVSLLCASEAINLCM
jgi:hypothetical protein